MTRFAITVNDADFKNLEAQFDLYKYGIKEALRDATADTIRDLKGIVGDRLAARLKVSAAVLKNRVQLRYGYRSGTGRVWFGINPISLSALGARQTASGVDAPPVSRTGAFIVGKLNDQVFKRDPLRRMKSNPARAALVKQVFDISEVSRDEVQHRIFPLVREVFYENLEERLKQSAAKRR